MKKPSIRSFMNKLKEKVQLESIKDKFGEFATNLKDLIISDHKLEKLQKEIDQMAQSRQEKQENLNEPNSKPSDNEYFNNITLDLKHMMAEINREEKTEWETIETTQLIKKKKTDSELQGKSKDNYWERSFKMLLTHYLSDGEEKSVVYFRKTPYIFKFPLLMRLYYKVKE